MKNDVAIITGGGSGIGRATCIKLTAEGAIVIASDLNIEGAEETAKIIRKAGGICEAVKTDVSQVEEVNALIHNCIAKYGQLDILVNNAGYGGNLHHFDKILDEDYHKMMRINVDGVFYGMRAALKQMKIQNRGAIVNTSSLAGLGGAPQMGAYAATKHAVVGMTKTAALEYGKYNIRINAVCPSVINTPMGSDFIEKDDKITSFVREMIPMKRFGEAEEVANTITWLCSDQSSFINGETVRVDGGHKS